MKKFFPLLLASMSAFSQDSSTKIDTAWWIKNPPFSGCLNLCVTPIPDTAPDTIRATIPVTLSPNGIAHARAGYVVRESGKPVIYLDCRKRALK